MTLEKELRCPNCGQRSLAADNVCWHCGEPLPWFEEDDTEEVRVREGWGARATPTSLITYAVITIIVIAALFIVTVLLAGQPKVQSSLGTRPAEGWREFTNDGKTLRTYLPETWTVLDGTLPDQGEQIAELLDERGYLIQGAYPLGSAVDDLEVIFAAQGTPEAPSGVTPFMIVAESKKLNRLEYSDASLFLDEGDFAISELKYIDDFEKSHLKIVMEQQLPDQRDTIRCRQQFIKGENLGMLMALCAPIRYYASQQAIFEEISSIFQRLSR